MRIRSDAYKQHKREWQAVYRKTEKGKATMRRADLKRRWGLTERYYERLSAQQNHCCAICGLSRDILGERLVIDHDHATGMIRELLCNSCNHLIGQAKESILVLQKAQQYVDKWHRYVVALAGIK
jgi:hypothetical protein